MGGSVDRWVRRGVGGVILAFRLGPMTYEQVARSLTLFMEQVVPLAGMKQAA